MLGLPGRIIDAIRNGPEGGTGASVSIAGISPVDGTILIAERALQFWPESLTVDTEIGWSFKEIPGLSHSLAQWTQNGGRTFSFEVQLSRFMKPFGNPNVFDQVKSLGGLNKPNSKIPLDNRPMNISVKEQMQWLRQFYLPDYQDAKVSGVDVTVSVPPPIAMICFPNMGLNEDGSDVIWAVMTQAPETYTLNFPNGEPRLASVSLSFKQIIQHPTLGIIPKARVLYGEIDKEENIARGGGRKTNSLTRDTGP